MPISIPSQRCHTVANTHPQFFQRICQLLRAFFHLAIVRAMNAAFDRNRNDFTVPVNFRCESQNIVHPKGAVHHHAVHSRTPLIFGVL